VVLFVCSYRLRQINNKCTQENKVTKWKVINRKNENYDNDFESTKTIPIPKIVINCANLL
jgi:hypothetical protein